MAQNEKTSQQVAAIASKAFQNPSSVSPEEIKALAASVLNQGGPDHSQGQQRFQQKNQQK